MFLIIISTSNYLRLRMRRTASVPHNWDFCIRLLLLPLLLLLLMFLFLLLLLLFLLLLLLFLLMLLLLLLFLLLLLLLLTLLLLLLHLLWLLLPLLLLLLLLLLLSLLLQSPSLLLLLLLQSARDFDVEIGRLWEVETLICVCIQEEDRIGRKRNYILYTTVKRNFATN